MLVGETEMAEKYGRSKRFNLLMPEDIQEAIERAAAEKAADMEAAGKKWSVTQEINSRLRISLGAQSPRPTLNQRLSLDPALISICCQRLNKAAALSEYVSLGGGDALTGGGGVGSGSHGVGGGVAQPLTSSPAAPLSDHAQQQPRRCALACAWLIWPVTRSRLALAARWMAMRSFA
jgi:hypothetical protein